MIFLRILELALPMHRTSDIFFRIRQVTWFFKCTHTYTNALFIPKKGLLTCLTKKLWTLKHLKLILIIKSLEWGNKKKDTWLNLQWIKFYRVDQKYSIKACGPQKYDDRWCEKKFESWYFIRDISQNRITNIYFFSKKL